MAMAGAVLLIACLNLANMLLARGTSRSKEIARPACRWRIALADRQAITLRRFSARSLRRRGRPRPQHLVQRSPCFSNSRVLLGSHQFLGRREIFVPIRPCWRSTFLFCFIATMLFSLGPALKATKADLVNDLKQQVGEPARIGRFSRFFAPRHISVMAQIALSLMLLFAAGLFFRGALKAAGLNPGFVAAGDLITEFDFSLIKKEPADSRRMIFDDATTRAGIAGCDARPPSARCCLMPISLTPGAFIRAKDTMPNDPKAPDPSVNALFTAITPGYFDALGVKLLRGRDFTQAECENKDCAPRRHH